MEYYLNEKMERLKPDQPIDSKDEWCSILYLLNTTGAFPLKMEDLSV